mgnify:CR=1 FL=1
MLALLDCEFQALDLWNWAGANGVDRDAVGLSRHAMLMTCLTRQGVVKELPAVTSEEFAVSAEKKWL